jgi:FKBP-type peptidyl-prolyl cis-trans isomerase 2
MSVVEDGSQVQVHYRGTLADGTEFDSSYERGEPITVQVGTGQLIPGFSNAIVGMAVGEKKEVTLSPDEAYGPHNPQALAEISRESFPENLELQEGMPIPLADGNGNRVMGRLSELKESTVTVDLNHPLAGEALNFEIEVVDIEVTSTESE